MTATAQARTFRDLGKRGVTVLHGFRSGTLGVQMNDAREASSEMDLVSRAANGDKDAFETIVRTHLDGVWRFAWGILGDAHHAEDATQDVFLKAFRALETFRGDSSLKTWLYTIAHRTCTDRLRKARLELVTLENISELQSAQTALLERTALALAIEGLPSDERTAFLLVDVLGLNREEAARVQDIPASTLKSRLARAHARLVEGLSERQAQ
ncbi:MAG: RNA polymerase sigma factor [Actinomycetota bacterium]